jgi:hypothetical protein
MIRETSPTIAKLNELYARGAHRPIVRMVQRSPRLYQGVCTCGWVSTNDAYPEMLVHAEDSLRLKFPPAPAPLRFWRW